MTPEQKEALLPYEAPLNFFDMSRTTQRGRDISRIGTAAALLAITTQDIADALIWAAPAGLHPDPKLPQTSVGSEVMHRIYAQAAELSVYHTAKLAHRMREYRDFYAVTSAEKDTALLLLKDGYRAYHSTQNIHGLWDDPSETLERSESHTVSLLRTGRKHEAAYDSILMTDMPCRGFSLANPIHTTYLLANLSILKSCSRFLGNLVRSDERFSASPAKTFDMLAHFTLLGY